MTCSSFTKIWPTLRSSNSCELKEDKWICRWWSLSRRSLKTKKKKVLHTLQSHPVGLIGPFDSCLTDPVWMIEFTLSWLCEEELLILRNFPHTLSLVVTCWWPHKTTWNPHVHVFTYMHVRMQKYSSICKHFSLVSWLVYSYNVHRN